MAVFNKVNLIFPKSEHTSTTFLWQPPLGLLSIATYAKKENPKIKINIFDETVLPLPKDFDDAEVIGINTQISNYKRCLEIAKKAKDNGCFVIFGGPFSTAIPEKILENRDFVDVVVVGDGEIAFNELLHKKQFSEINNLAYRKGNNVVINKQIPMDLNKIPFPDRSFLNMDIYFKNFRNFFLYLDF